MGGARHHPLVVAVSEGLTAAGVAALRLDLPNPDVVATLAAPLGLTARVLVAPPVASFAFASTDDLPSLVLVPAHDQYGGPDAVDAAIGGRPATTIETIEGCDHFLAGAIDRIADRAVERLSTQARPIARDRLRVAPAASTGARSTTISLLRGCVANVCSVW